VALVYTLYCSNHNSSLSHNPSLELGAPERGHPLSLCQKKQSTNQPNQNFTPRSKRRPSVSSKCTPQPMRMHGLYESTKSRAAVIARPLPKRNQPGRKSNGKEARRIGTMVCGKVGRCKDRQTMRPKERGKAKRLPCVPPI